MGLSLLCSGSIARSADPTRTLPPPSTPRLASTSRNILPHKIVECIPWLDCRSTGSLHLALSCPCLCACPCCCPCACCCPLVALQDKRSVVRHRSSGGVQRSLLRGCRRTLAVRLELSYRVKFVRRTDHAARPRERARGERGGFEAPSQVELGYKKEGKQERRKKQMSDETK